jgi:hypothetical protein
MLFNPFLFVFFQKHTMKTAAPQGDGGDIQGEGRDRL